MAIEPLSSAMTYQAQTTQQARPVQKVAEDMDVAAQEQNNIYDSTTVKVAAPEKREEQGGGQSGSEGGNSPKDQQQASTEQIKKAVEQLNKNLSHSEAVFGIHDATNRVTIKIVDKESKEVIREIPPEKTLDMIAKAWELAGLLVDERR